MLLEMLMNSEQRRQPAPAEQLKRRGLMAGLIALAAGLLGKATERVADASHGGGIDPNALHVAVTAGSTVANNAAGATQLIRNNAGQNQRALQVNNNNGEAIHGFSDQVALFGETNSGIGVQATTNSGTGVFSTSTTNVGVYGQSNAYHGVVGVGGSIGAGVYGTNSSGYGVWGQSTSSLGVYGFSTDSRGVQGQSTNNIGVYGFSGPNVGVWGETFTNVGVMAIGGTGTALRAEAPSGTAGVFIGPVVMGNNLNVNGNLVVLGTKSAAVPDPGGGYRLLYCVEAPESWFQDFGQAQLVGDRAEVPLDPVFAAAVHTNDYHVILTEYGTNSGLYVSRRGPQSFEVRAAYDKGSTVFGYAVVARRKDAPQTRMPRISGDQVRPPAGPAQHDRPTPLTPQPGGPPPLRRS